mmetsp:Transcript_19157/g.58379  ORF Transcript_19157/g.58379 Transcript_19157/m.58379 type:complete len:274 (+) Transcript_19157:547-1368(+)
MPPWLATTATGIASRCCLQSPASASSSQRKCSHWMARCWVHLGRCSMRSNLQRLRAPWAAHSRLPPAVQPVNLLSNAAVATPLVPRAASAGVTVTSGLFGHPMYWPTGNSRAPSGDCNQTRSQNHLSGASSAKRIFSTRPTSPAKRENSVRVPCWKPRFRRMRPVLPRLPRSWTKTSARVEEEGAVPVSTSSVYSLCRSPVPAAASPTPGPWCSGRSSGSPSRKAARATAPRGSGPQPGTMLVAGPLRPCCARAVPPASPYARPAPGRGRAKA